MLERSWLLETFEISLETLCMEAVFFPYQSVHKVHGIIFIDTTTFLVGDRCHHSLLYSLGERYVRFC
jgi:hypothetical protein